MVSSNTKSILLLVIAFGLAVGPITFFLQQNTSSDDDPIPVNDQPDGPDYLRQVKTYTGKVEGEVVDKEGVVIISAVSDVGGVEQINDSLFSIDGVNNVSVVKTDNPGETGLYLFDINISVDPGLTEKAGYLASKILGSDPFNMNIQSIGVPAKVSFPDEVSLSRQGSTESSTIELPEEVSSFVFFHTQKGDSKSFSLRVDYLGLSMDRAIAFEEFSSQYLPPVDTVEENVSGEILNVTEYSFKFSTEYGQELNTTEIEALFDNASVVFDKPVDFVQVQTNNSSFLVSELNASGFRAEERSGGVSVWINGSLENTTEAILAVDDDADIGVPEGSLTLKSPKRFVDGSNSTLGSLLVDDLGGYVEKAKGCLFIEKYNETYCDRVPPVSSPGDVFSFNASVNRIFGEFVSLSIELA